MATDSKLVPTPPKNIRASESISYPPNSIKRLTTDCSGKRNLGGHKTGHLHVKQRTDSARRASLVLVAQSWARPSLRSPVRYPSSRTGIFVPNFCSPQSFSFRKTLPVFRLSRPEDPVCSLTLCELSA